MPDLDEQLRSAGARWRAEQSDAVVDLARVTARSRSRRALVTVGVSAVVVVAAVAVIAGRTDTRPRVRVAPTSDVPTTPVGPRPDVIELSSEIVQPDGLAVDGNRLFVTGFPPQPGGVAAPVHLQEIDADTGAVLGDVTLPDNWPGAIEVGDGALWVSEQQGEASTEIVKIDIATMRIVARIPGIKNGDVAVTPGVVWATDGVGGLRRIDPATARVVATIDLHSNIVYPPLVVEAGLLGVFVGNSYNGTIQRIDQATNTAGPEIHVASETGSMIELNGSLWVESGSDGRQLVEVANGTKPLPPIDLGERVLGVVTDGTSLWFATDSPHLLRVDPVSRSVTKVALPVGAKAWTIAADPSTGAVWAASTTPTPRLLRVPTTSKGSHPAEGVTCAPRADCPPPRPAPCPAHQTEPSMNGRYCGPAPSAGNGLGPSGECTGRETAPPCGSGMIPRRYYPYTLPGRCDGRVVLDGRRWFSELPPPTPSPDMYVWVSITADGRVAGWISPNGAVGFRPDTGQPAPVCTGSG